MNATCPFGQMYFIGNMERRKKDDVMISILDISEDYSTLVHKSLSDHGCSSEERAFGQG